MFISNIFFYLRFTFTLSQKVSFQINERNFTQNVVNMGKDLETKIANWNLINDNVKISIRTTDKNHFFPILH